jgi:hypothetical protein
MKRIVTTMLDIDLETISRLSDEQAEEIYGGVSCIYKSCKPGTKLPKKKLIKNSHLKRD